MDYAKVLTEAQSKVFWGDTPEEVIKFLMAQGIARDDAAGIVTSLVQERAATLRRIGTRKILIGIGLILVPIVTYMILACLGFIPFNVMMITVAIGLCGVYQFFKGTFMLCAPKTEHGDVADM